MIFFTFEFVAISNLLVKTFAMRKHAWFKSSSLFHLCSKVEKDIEFGFLQNSEPMKFSIFPNFHKSFNFR